MEEPRISEYPDISDGDFGRLREYIQKNLGFKMPPEKRRMIQSRLSKRLRRLGMSSFEDYCKHFFSTEGRGQEWDSMVDVITTNKTEFFREPQAFDTLTQKALPELVFDRGAGKKRKLLVWSAGCSTGEEPYTLGMVLDDYSENCHKPGLNYSILATDISKRVLEMAAQGIYEEHQAEAIPVQLRKRYLLKGNDTRKNQVRISPELRRKVFFRHQNLINDFPLRNQFDIIFCRNVIIYFDKKTQEILLKRFCEQLHPGGYLFMGYTETLRDLDLPLEPVGPMVYQNSG